MIPTWLPNAISAVRVLLVPMWLWCAEGVLAAALAGRDAEPYRFWALVTLLIIGASDIVDGWLARRFGLASHLGATLDAVADKLCQVVLITWLTLRAQPGGSTAFLQLPLWFLGVLIARDALLLAGYAVLRRRLGTVQVVHRNHGKTASLLLFALLVVVTAGLAAAWTRALLAVIAAVVVASTVSYFRDGISQLKSVEARAA